MDLTTSYLGLTLKNPLVASASPLTLDLDNIRRIEDAGGAALVLPSLFEEQIEQEAGALEQYTRAGPASFAEAFSYLPSTASYRVGPHEYLETIRKAHDAGRNSGNCQPERRHWRCVDRPCAPCTGRRCQCH